MSQFAANEKHGKLGILLAIPLDQSENRRGNVRTHCTCTNTCMSMNRDGKRPQSRCRSTVTIIKVTYIICAVALTTSLIVGAFLVHMLVLPYFHESEFQPGVCAVVRIDLHHAGRLKCENKCSKERSSFPCLRVTINFEKDHVNRTGLLFDTIVTHQNYRGFGVGDVTFICLICSASHTSISSTSTV